MVALLPGSRAKARLFYFKYLRGEKGRLSLNITREICLYLTRFCEMLAQVNCAFLCFFNTSTWEPKVRLSASIQVDAESIWVVLEDGHLFCSGGGKYQKGWDTKLNVAYLLGRDGAVTPLPHMLLARKNHGVIHVQPHCVLVFGGGKV